MALSHDNPTGPRTDNKGNQIWSRAPYNFVSAPEQTLEVDQPLLTHDRYHAGALTGWIDCTLETYSPTYVRGMLSQREFNRLEEKKTDELTPQDRDAKAPFYSNGEKIRDGHPIPRIPGSSLRGMVHQLVEVLGYGRVRWVAKEPVFSFRAVAAPKSDPLSQPYRQVIGPMAKNVRSGYLRRDTGSGHWFIRPARTPKSFDLPDDSSYLKVKEHQIGPKDIPGYIRLEDKNYRPQIHRISFDPQIRQSKTGLYTSIDKIGTVAANYRMKGRLVCSGNMIESKPGGRTRRRSQALVLEPDLNAAEIPVSEQTILDYVNGLSPYQKEDVYQAWSGSKGEGWGCLADDQPVFYVVAGSGKEVACFGHSPNFRIPARQNINGVERAATPFDFIPTDARVSQNPDLTDVLFGWVEDDVAPQVTKSFAGRVFFSDATFVKVKEGEKLWYRPDPMTPHVLSGPKPTTFQHYLTQNTSAGHDPNQRQQLAHYGTPTNETVIRGYKFYWTKGSNPPIEANRKELEHPKQLTRILPVNPGVTFKFRVRFENLRPAELGALWWALKLPAGTNPRHRLGMGKPFGMGVVSIQPELTLTDRVARYTSFFSNDGRWQEAAEAADAQPYVKEFEALICKSVHPTAQRLEDIERIRDLLIMLEWREGTPEWLDWTRYMEIEREPDGRNRYIGNTNEYKERPVLPTPSGVVALSQGKSPQGTRTQIAANRPSGPSQPRQTIQRETSVQESTPENKPGKRSEPADLKPGSSVRVKIYDVRTSGILDLELVEYPEQDQWMGLIKPEDLGTKKYKEGDQASLEVVEVRPDDKLVVCRVPTGAAGSRRKSGEVKFFRPGQQQAYGFIVPDDGGKDVYVRESDLGEGVEGLNTGQQVTFLEGKDMKGRVVAKDVKPA